MTDRVPAKHVIYRSVSLAAAVFRIAAIGHADSSADCWSSYRKPLQPLHPGLEDVEFTRTVAVRSDTQAFYYVHVLRTDGEPADSSPIATRQQ